MLRDKQQASRGFTLIEVLVVVAIIALLISILLPSLRAAREEAKAVACQSGVKQIMLGIQMYQTDFGGSVPIGLWSENHWDLPKEKLWFYKLHKRYLPNPKIWICPADPYGSRFDFLAMKNNIPYSNTTVPSCGYGMNYLLRHSGLGDKAFNIEKYPSKRPMNTILLAEVGPDHGLENFPFYPSGVGQPWRDGGRLVWDDGNSRGWYAGGPTWLTARHNGSITMTTMGGSVQRVPTLKQVRTRIRPEYEDCKRADCYLCNYYPAGADKTHYSFADSKLYWWVGPRQEH